jgi:hypothetical protein
MKISATFNVTFQILDRDLYDTFESDNSEWVNFLTAVLDSVRYSEDWTKKLVSTEGDELYWDEDEDHGEAQVDVTVEIDFGNDLEWYSNWASDMKESWEVTLPDDASEFEATTFLNLVAPPNENPYRNAGPLWSIVRWGTLIPEYNDGDGCFLEYEGEEQDMYLEGIRNLPERMFFSGGQFTDAAGNDFNVYGSDVFEDFYVEPA